MASAAKNAVVLGMFTARLEAAPFQNWFEDFQNWFEV